MAVVNVEFREHPLASFVKDIPRLLVQYATAKSQMEFNRDENEKDREQDKLKFNTKQISEHGMDNLVIDEGGFYQSKPMSEYNEALSPELAMKGAEKKQDFILAAEAKFRSLTWTGNFDEDWKQYGYIQSGFQSGKSKAETGVLSKIPYIAAGTIDIAPGISDQRDLDYLQEYFRNSGIFDKNKDVGEEVEFVARDIGLIGEGEDLDEARPKLEARWVGFVSGVEESGKLVSASEYDKYNLEMYGKVGTATQDMVNTAAFANQEWDEFESSLDTEYAPVDGVILHSVGGKPYDIATAKGRKKMASDGYPWTSKVVSMLSDARISKVSAIRRLMNNMDTAKLDQNIMENLKIENPALFSELKTAMDSRAFVDQTVSKSYDIIEGFEPSREDFETQQIKADDFQMFLNSTKIPGIAKSLMIKSLNPKKKQELIQQMGAEIKRIGLESQWQPFIHEYLRNLESVQEL